MSEVVLDAEIVAMQEISSALETLDHPARTRVLAWAAARFEIVTSRKMVPEGPGDSQDGGEDSDAEAAPDRSRWSHFAELFDAAGPTTEAKRLLVAAFWVQIVGGASQFGSLELNKMLKDLGHGATHTARSMDELIDQKPALVLQLKKAGKTKQARKTYKLTRAGSDAVEAMINGA